MKSCRDCVDRERLRKSWMSCSSAGSRWSKNARRAGGGRTLTETNELRTVGKNAAMRLVEPDYKELMRQAHQKWINERTPEAERAFNKALAAAVADDRAKRNDQ